MKPTIIIAALLLSLGLATSAGASLVKDQVTVQYWENDQLFQNTPFVIGQSPAIITGFGRIRLDIDAEGVKINFIGPNQFIGGNTNFFGIKIVGLNDFDNPDWILLGAEVTENTMTSTDLWYAEQDARLVLDPKSGDVAFDWNQMSFTGGQNFTAMLEFGPNPIPIPATMALFVTGLIGFILLTRKKRRR